MTASPRNIRHCLRGVMHPMRILILSCNTGEGHNSAARAILEELARRGVVCDMTDSLSFWSPKMSKFICGWHVRIYRRAPSLFNAGYRTAEKFDPDPDDRSLTYTLLSQGADKLHAYLVSGKYDAVICTHVFAGLLMRRTHREYGCKIPFFLVATDYTCTPYSAEAQADYYLIPDESLVPEFVRAGISEARLKATGIPISQRFFAPRDQSGSRTALGLPEKGRIVLMMCGSMGCGPMRRTARLLTEQLPRDTLLVAICGSNAKLFDDLSELGPLSNLKVVGFTKEVPAYMDAADLILTKPGGLSSTEAAARRLPMIFIDAVGGCEARNLEFFQSCGLSECAETPEEICTLVLRILDDPAALPAMAQALEKRMIHNGAKEICQFVLSICGGQP